MPDVAYLCRTCGVQYPPSPEPPERCRICDDPRQYVGWGGQSWTSLPELVAEGHRTVLREVETDLLGIGAEPQVGIGQRALLVQTPAGNLLWDVPGFVDGRAMERVAESGGLAAVSASHPHFYGVMAEWALAFDAEILLPEADRGWFPRTTPRTSYYRDRVSPLPGVTLVRLGGHFPGSAVVHWEAGAGGAGALLTGDTVTVVQDRRWVSVMWSYPNLVPVDPATLARIEEVLAGLRYDRIHGGWWGRTVSSGAADAVRRSFARYREAVADAGRLEP